MNIIFDFGNVLVRWEPKRVFLPLLNNDEGAFDHFWNNICDADFRNRIDAGEPEEAVIAEYQQRHPDFAHIIAAYFSEWEATLPGEIPGMMQVVKELKNDPRHHIYGLTNWSMETFPQARKKFEILQQIDNYVVSGDVKMVKPNPDIYQLLIDRFGLNVRDCVFVDDNPANVETARRLGMKGIRFKNAEELRKQLFFL